MTRLACFSVNIIRLWRPYMHVIVLFCIICIRLKSYKYVSRLKVSYKIYHYVVTSYWGRDWARGCCLQLHYCNSHLIVNSSESMGSHGFFHLFAFPCRLLSCKCNLYILFCVIVHSCWNLAVQSAIPHTGLRTDRPLVNALSLRIDPGLTNRSKPIRFSASAADPANVELLSQ